MIVNSIKTRIFKENENLFDFVSEHIKFIPERSVLVITSKIVALSEGRIREAKTKKGKEKIIRSESDLAIKTKYTWLTVKDGIVMASAGIDESNARGKLILLPKNSFAAAKKILTLAKKRYRVKKIGVLITDSRLFPLRAGVVGFAVGYAGFKGIRDDRGEPDLFGRKMKMSQSNIADSLATAAVLEMGESNEQMPLALIKDAPVEFTNKEVFSKELLIKPKDDLYRPIFRKLKKGA